MVPDSIQFNLIVERVEPKEERQDQPDPAVTGRLSVGRILHPRDALTGPEDGDVGRHDDKPPDKHSHHGQALPPHPSRVPLG